MKKNNNSQAQAVTIKNDKFCCDHTSVAVAAHVPTIRARTRLTQKHFAEKFGFSLSALRKWEQGLRVPTGAAMALLTIIDRNPEAALEALEGGG